jgi:ABC-type uncharacterized transport system substrate-binding protein
MPKYAIDVAIGGKADIGWCTANVCFDPKRTSASSSTQVEPIGCWSNLGAAMRRREFIGLVSTWPFAVRAQQSERVRRIGILFAAYSEADKAGQARLEAFLKGLQDLGWGDKRNIRIDYRWGAGDIEQVKTFATDLVQSAPDIIIAVGNPAIAQLHRLKSTIPIIFTQVSEPVDSGFVASLARPGGNITGFQNFEPAMGGKWLGVLKEIAPNVKRVGALFGTDASPHASFLRAAEEVAPSLGVTVATVDIQNEFESAIAGPAGLRTDCFPTS